MSREQRMDMGAKPVDVVTTHADDCRLSMCSVQSGRSLASAERTENPLQMLMSDTAVDSNEREVSQYHNHLELTLDNIVKRLDDLLNEQFRHVSLRKRQSILERVRETVEIAKGEAKSLFGNSANDLFAEINMTPQELRRVLPIASYNSTLVEKLALEFGCKVSDLANIVRGYKSLNNESQSQIDDLTSRMANTGRINVEEPNYDTELNSSQGERDCTADWTGIGKQLSSLYKFKKRIVQSHQAEFHSTNVGRRRHQRSTSSERSNRLSRRSSNESTVGESTSIMRSTSSSRGSSKASVVSHSVNEMLSVFKEVFKAQSVAEVAKYNGKNSLSEFLRAVDVKYPPTIWSNRDRRDILVNHLVGSARSIYKNLPDRVKQGSFESVVVALKEARRNPCEKLSLVRDWDDLTMGIGESVSDFCCRMEEISRQIHPSDSWDFHLASKLYSTLEHWKDSYHMLAALDAHDGMAYDTVKGVALRLEKTHVVKPSKNQSLKKSRLFDGDIVAKKGKISNHEARNQQCYKCGKRGHYAANCRTQIASVSKTSPANDARNGSSKRQNRVPTPSRALSTFVDEWCGMMRTYKGRADEEISAVGKPTLCKAVIFGMEVMALIDTGSVISILPAVLLKQAKRQGFDIDQNVELISTGQKQKVFDASGNEMNFVAMIRADVGILRAGKARVTMHVQKDRGTVLLLGTNVLRALGIQLRLCPHPELSRSAIGHVNTAYSTDRVVIPPGATAVIAISGFGESGEGIFLSDDTRITSGVCSVEGGSSAISVANRDNQTWVINKDQPLGIWSDDSIVDPSSLDTLNAMPDMQSFTVLPEPRRLQMLTDILLPNKQLMKLSKELSNVIRNYSDTFAMSDAELGRTNLVEHDIDVQGHKPIRQKTRPVPYGVRDKVEEMLHDLMHRKIIENSQSPWASPIVLVAKKDGATRLCVDYQEVNKVTKKDSYPLPPIDVTLQNLEGKGWFSSLDLASGYWQVPLTERAKEISAFTTSAGQFQFTVLPFGLTNAPSEFQRLMDRVLVNLKGPEVSVYLDDVLIATETEERHIEVLELILKRFREARLRLNPQKCRLLQSSLEFLGHVVDKNGIKTCPDKISTIQNYPTPSSISQLRTFLGMAGYYRKFILRYAQIAKPLYALTSTKTRFIWLEEQNKAFRDLKESLVNAPVLGQPNIKEAREGSRPFIIYTDASRIGVGAVLAQKGDDGFLHPLFFASKPFSSAERNYHVTDQEALAVIFSLKKFHYFIFGIHTIVRTDHAALTSLFKRTHVSPRVLRWALEIQRYDLSIEHVKGAANSVADALSRGPVDVRCESPILTSYEHVVCSVQELEWLQELRGDPDFGVVVEAIENGKDEEVMLPRFGRKLSSLDFTIDSGRLQLINEDGSFIPVVPRSRRHDVYVEAHPGALGGHFHARKMYNQLRKIVFWPGLHQDLARWCKECQVCFLANNRRRNVPPLRPIITTKPFEIVGIDLLEMGLSSRGNRYIVTIVDHFTKYLGAYPVSNKHAETIAEVLFSNWICMCGRWPTALLSDRGSEFENAIVKALCSVMGIQQKFTKGYCPRENGVTERANATLIQMLKKKTTVVAEWDSILPAVVYAYNAAPHEATGESPHFLLYGHDPKCPSSVIPSMELSPYTVDYESYKTEFLNGLELARNFITEHANAYRERMKKSYDKGWKTYKTPKIVVGNRVYVNIPAEKGKSRHPKLTIPWEGPFRVIGASDNSALVTLIGGNKPPVEIPFDHLIKIPSQIGDTPVKGRTTRGKRGRPKRAEEELSKNCLSVQNNRFSPFSSTFSSSTEVHHVDWHCPGRLMYQGMEVECSADVNLHEIIPSAPFGALRSPYELSRILSILTQSHVPDTWRTVRILDRNYDYLTPCGLGLTLSFYRQHCVHLMLSSVARAGTIMPEHPPRGKSDPYNLGAIADEARKYAETHPWTSASWKDLKPRKNLIILPSGFENVLDCLHAECQKAVVMKRPEDLQPNWFTENYSAIILFSSADFAGTTRWRGAWTVLLQQVSKGTELFTLAGPENCRDWKRSMDMPRDLCEETVAQRPSLKTRIRCLLPFKSQYEVIGTAFRTLTFEQNKLFTESAAKRFWAATMAQQAVFLKLAPFNRTQKHRRELRQIVPRGQPYRGNSRYRSGEWQHWRGNDGLENEHGQNPRMPLQMVGNRLFKLVPVNRKNLAHTYGGRGRGNWRQY